MKRMIRPILMLGLAIIAVLGMTSAPVRAGIVYSNDFETDAAGFSVSDRNTFDYTSSTWLGRKGGHYTAVLTLTGLLVGAVYDLAFDLYIGGSWDGSLVYGPDKFSLDSSSDGLLVNATFRNGVPIGDPDFGQTYSDATPLGDGGFFHSREGSDSPGAPYAPTYYFGHGAGNPMLSFTAGNATEFLTFRSVDYQGGSDEFFALDNVVVRTDAEAVGAQDSAKTAPYALIAAIRGRMPMMFMARVRL